VASRSWRWTARWPSLGRRYRWLWLSSTVANVGDGVYAAALPLLAAALTRDPLAFAGVTIAAQAPWFLLALPAGVVVDRADRRRLMIGVNAARGVILLIASAAVMQGWATLPLLYLLAFALGTAETLFDNAAPALLPATVDAGALERANGRLLSAQVATNRFAGPPLGSLLFAFAAAVPFMVNSGAYLLSAACLIAIHGAFRPAPGDGTARAVTMRAGILEGLRYTVRNPLLRTLALILALMNLVWAGTFALLALYALEVLGVSAAGFGILLGAGGIGSVGGGLLASRRTRRWPRPRLDPARLPPVVRRRLPGHGPDEQSHGRRRPARSDQLGQHDLERRHHRATSSDRP
jgi:MFS family permease